MSPQDLTGAYTYRSFLNEPEPHPIFNSLRFGEAAVDRDRAGRLSDRHSCLPCRSRSERPGIHGHRRHATNGTPPTLELEGVGRPGTGTADFDYKYVAYPVPAFSDAVDQRPSPSSAR